MTSYESLTVETEGTITTVTLTGPGKGNAMGPAFWREMPVVFAALDKDPATRVVILRGSGEHFSYGLDLMRMMGDLGPRTTGEQLAAQRQKLLDLIGDMQQACDQVARCRKPVIAAVHGWCIGGGLDLASACDVRVCSAEAKFSLREVKLAMVADIGSLQRLPRLIGEGATRELAYTGRNVEAAEALSLRLVTHVYETPEQLFVEARALARQIADNSPVVVQGIKQVLDYTADKSLADGLRFVAVWNAAFLQSKDLTEAITAFLEKRAARFTGE